MDLGNPYCLKLAQENLVHRNAQTTGRCALASFKQSRTPTTGPSIPSCFSVVGFNNMDVETQVLTYRDIIGSVIPTVLKV